MKDKITEKDELRTEYNASDFPGGLEHGKYAKPNHKETTIVKHLNRQIPPKAHTPMYNFHKFWSRKTWNVVGQYIENYCPEGGVVFDPFGGSGVTAMEALKRGRKVIIADLNPIASEITRLTIKSVNLSKIHEAFVNIEYQVKNKIMNLYKTKCRKCKKVIVFNCAIWKDNNCVDIRYKKCPYCGDEQRSNNNKPVEYDENILDVIDNHNIKEWYPTNKLYYNTGNPFMKKEYYESIDELFTKRNIYALSILMEAIEKQTDRDIKPFLKLAFTSMTHLCSRMTPVRPTRPLSSAWTEHSYWYANEFMEQNVWEKFESSVLGKQGIIKAKEESNEYFNGVKFAKNFKDVIEDNADVFIYNGDCIELMENMYKFYGDKGCVDYIFTDPPYDSSIQFGELSYLWAAWAKFNNKYLDNIESKEIIHNEKQNKDFIVYTSLLQNSFNGMFRVLKPKSHLTLTFHNPTFKVRNATTRIGVLAGFELKKIHHQELARPSAKSLLQPFGSAQGDFYIRFHKPDLGDIGFKPELIDEHRFAKIVLDTTTKILAERGEPTPYTIIINAIDPELAKQGYFSELDTGLNSEIVLKEHLDHEYILIDARIGGSTGKLWWFKDPNIVPHLQKIPLSERVEQTVLRQLQSRGRVTFTDIWEAVSVEFPNSLTSDQSSIKSSLEDYARPLKGGYWIIKPRFKSDVVVNEHTAIMSLLAEIGKKQNFKISIGKVEQSHRIDSQLVNKSILKDYLDYSDITRLKDVQNFDDVAGIDLLWIKDDRVYCAFEVESTTSMTSALQRCSNLEKDVKKIMLFPQDRINQFKRKMKSPLFNERYESDNWSFVLFEELYKEWDKHKSNSNLYRIINIGTSKQEKKEKTNSQIEVTFE
ncbi:DNA adenine methylase [bacterium]|nr:DNA adenine methylase [bacterium]